MRHLWIIRHGKSADGSPDHDRPLNHRGLHDGPNMQAWYARQEHRASWIWASSARRAQMTAEFVGQGFNAPVIDAPDLYLPSPETLLDQLRSTPDTEPCAAVVAHNPGLTYLVNLLSGDWVIDNLVTFGSALFAAPIESWTELRPGNCELLTLVSPKTLPE